MTTHFYLVRHAHANWTPDEQRPLSSRGSKDAQRVGKLLAGFPITHIYASPYQRARQTIEPLAAILGLPIAGEPDLRERELGNIPDEIDFYAAAKQTWQDPTFSHPCGETNRAAQQRGSALVRRLLDQHSSEHLVLSTHGTLLALILQWYDPSVDYALWEAMTMPDIYLLTISQAQKPVISRMWAK